MEFLKVSVLLLISLNCCFCAPNLRRIIDEKDDSPIEIPLAQEEEVFIEENANLEQDLLRNQIGNQNSFQEDEPELIPVNLPNPIKSTVDFKSPISAHKHAISKMTGVDPYEKLLESFIRRFMSSVLKAEIKEVRVEEMGHSKRNKTIYY